MANINQLFVKNSNKNNTNFYLLSNFSNSIYSNFYLLDFTEHWIDGYS